MLSLFQSEEDIKSENDEADDMPEVQDTVQFIPGSKLLWRINSRPPNSSQVTVSICPCFALAGDLSRRTQGMVQGPLLSLLGIGAGSGSSCCTEIILQQAVLWSCAESSPAVPELAQGMCALRESGDSA